MDGNIHVHYSGTYHMMSHVQLPRCTEGHYVGLDWQLKLWIDSRKHDGHHTIVRCGHAVLTDAEHAMFDVFRASLGYMCIEQCANTDEYQTATGITLPNQRQYDREYVCLTRKEGDAFLLWLLERKRQEEMGMCLYI